MFEELTRLNSRQRKKWYEFLVKRDGEQCKKCGRMPPNEVKKLIIDRIDNKGEYVPENIQLLCYRCNYLKNPRKVPLDLCECESVCDDESIEKIGLDKITSIDINRQKQPSCEPYVEKRLAKQPEGIEYGDLVNSIAHKIKISSVTAERYLKPLCSSEGPFEIIQDGKKRLVRRKKR